MDLADLNRRLHAGTIELDWSHVGPNGVTLAALRTLLAGLNLSEHIEVLGAATITEELLPAIQKTLLMQPVERLAETLDLSAQAQAEPIAVAAPELWQPVPVDQPSSQLEMENEEVDISTQPAATASPLLLAVPAPAKIRAELEALVIRDLLGPVNGADEIVEDAHVYERYLVGMLAPSETPIVREEMDNTEGIEEGADKHGPADTDNTASAGLNPSSMGLSFRVDLTVSELLVTAHWGHYQRVSGEAADLANTSTRHIWQRTPRGSTLRLVLTEGTLPTWSPEPEEQPEVEVRSLVRRHSDCWMVTLFLVNGQKKPRQLVDRAWLFQPVLSVETSSGAPIFHASAKHLPKVLKPEDRAMAMLYRQQINFAAGHGVSTHVTTTPGDSTSAVRIATTFTPHYDVPHTEAPTSQELPGLADLCLDMHTLAATPAPELPALLQPLLTTYEAWIAAQERALADPAKGLQTFQQEGRESLAHCRRTLGRIQVGIDLLTRDPQAAQSFAFMNRAMWQQRIHTQYAEEPRNGGERSVEMLDTPTNRSWRPFQLAFILLNLPSLTSPAHPNRSNDASAIADLLWFPTGGGKTEAYLGLTAYTLAIRRLQGTIAGRSGLDGVAVIMRYTLRLLTLQQFQRAAALICACEIIRRTEGHTIWGTTPFRLGLWVGMSATPNTTQGSDDAIVEARGAAHHYVNRSGSPRQLTNCPWCGSLIDGGKDLSVDKQRQRTLMYCGDPFGICPFSHAQAPQEGLPVLVVDEEIYRFLPGLLIATADKFAQLPWKGQTQMLFGQVKRYCARHGFLSPEIAHANTHQAIGTWPRTNVQAYALLRPPGLIIQDELHLISGPLGTMVGLYETAVDHLCLGQRERSALNRIGMIGCLNANILVQPPDDALVQKAMDIPLPLFLRNPPGEPGMYLRGAVHYLICSFHSQICQFHCSSTIFSRRKADLSWKEYRTSRITRSCPRIDTRRTWKRISRREKRRNT